MIQTKLFSPAFIIALIFFTSQIFPQDRAAKAVLNSSSIDFGRIPAGQKIERKLTIRNAGNADLIIEGMKMTVPSLVIKAKHVIPPGEESTISVELDTTIVDGEFQGQVVLITNDPQSPNVQFEIKGLVESSISVEPRKAIFLQAFRWELKEKESTVSIVNKNKEPLTNVVLRTEGTGFTPTLTTVEEGQRYTLSVKFNADASLGKAVGNIVVDTDKEDVQIPVYTFLKDKVYFNPTYLDFGRINLEDIEKDPELLTYRKVSVFIYQYHGQNFQIQIKSCPQFLAIEKTPAEDLGSVIQIPGQGQTAVFELAVSLVKERLKRGKFEEVITLSTNDKDFPVIQIPVSLEVT